MRGSGRLRELGLRRRLLRFSPLSWFSLVCVAASGVDTELVLTSSSAVRSVRGLERGLLRRR